MIRPITIQSAFTPKPTKGRKGVRPVFSYKKAKCFYCNSPLVLSYMNNQYKKYNLDSTYHNCSGTIDSVSVSVPQENLTA